MLSVLAIDDEPDLLDIVRHFLERYGDMKVETTPSTTEALNLISKKEYDAIILDYFMPEISGIEFLKILRAKGDTTPVIIFTGVGREHAAIEALNNGADFFLQKGEDPKTQFRELAHMIKQARDRRSVGRSPGTSKRIIADVMSFSPEAMVGIDREGTVIAWNTAMAELSGVNAEVMVGRSDHEYAVPFYGKKVPMLVDLVFATDAELGAHNYNIVSRDKGAVIAWTRVVRPDNRELTLWMRAMPVYDGKGVFIGAIGSVRDITDLAATALKSTVSVPQSVSLPSASVSIPVQAGLLDRITGKAKAAYRQGVRLCYKEGKPEEAIQYFDKATEIDSGLAYVWNDRGLCLKELGKFEEAQKSFERALELSPKDEEYLYDYGEVLETIGILRRENKILNSAIHSFSMVTEISPNNANAWNHIGICAREIGQEDEARNAFERASSIVRAKKDRMFQRRRDAIL
jgi:PAS domain S-box-containing protein